MTDQHTEWLTRREAAQLCRVSERTFDRWVAHRKCPKHMTPGGHPRFARADVEALVTRDSSPADPTAPALL